MPAETTRPGEIPLDATIDALCQVLRVWDPESYRHSESTARYAVEIGREMGLTDDTLGDLRAGALLHDIGKMGVDLSVLRKPDLLDAEEVAHVQAHPAMGERILERMLPPPIVACAAAHHEQPDGEGYPRGLADDEIPLLARICRVADVVDSLLSEQSYHPALTVEEALDELRGGAGTTYDSEAVAALVSVLQRREHRDAAA